MQRNWEQIEPELLEKGHNAVLDWLYNLPQNNDGQCSCHLCPPCGYCVSLTDVQVCDCCGDGQDWYGSPGEHYTYKDLSGKSGPYAYNGGYCECH